MPDEAYRVDREAVRLSLDLISERQHAAGFPACSLCGGLTRRLDEFGLCPRVSAPHEEWRADVRAEEARRR